MLIEILAFSLMKMHLKVSSAKWRPFCLGLNVLKHLLWSPIVVKCVSTLYPWSYSCCYIASLCECRGPPACVNTLRPGKICGRHFGRQHIKCISLNKNFWILNKISLKYVLQGLIDNMAALVLIMAWRRTGAEPLSEAMLPCYTDAYMRHLASMS